MEWPNKIKIQIFSKREKFQVSNLILFIVILASRKNDYSLGPFLTNDSGELVLLRQNIELEIAKVKKEFPMDYCDELSDCQSRILITIESKESMMNRCNRLKMFYPNKADNLRALLDGVANFVSKEVVQEVDLSKIKDVITVNI